MPPIETTARVAVVGAGLAGLAAAARLAERGVDVVVLEAAPQPGGTSAMSTGYIWRYRDMATFRWSAPDGDTELQQVIFDRWPEAVRWLSTVGVERLSSAYMNPLRESVRVQPRQMTDALTQMLPDGGLRLGARVVGARRCGGEAGEIELHLADGSKITAGSVIFAGGGYAADTNRLASECGAAREASQHWLVRNAGGSDGSSQRAACQLGAMTTESDGEFYARAMPAGVQPRAHELDSLAQVYAAHATVVGGDGQLIPHPDHDWADVLTVRHLAQQASPSWYLVEERDLEQATPAGTVAECVRRAHAAGATVLDAADAPLERELHSRGVALSEGARAAAQHAAKAIQVVAGITHTISGLAVDGSARVQSGVASGGTGSGAVSGVFAAGVEAGGVATGGYASGLAQALVLGLVAAEQLS